MAQFYLELLDYNISTHYMDVFGVRVLERKPLCCRKLANFDRII